MIENAERKYFDLLDNIALLLVTSPIRPFPFLNHHPPLLSKKPQFLIVFLRRGEEEKRGGKKKKGGRRLRGKEGGDGKERYSRTWPPFPSPPQPSIWFLSSFISFPPLPPLTFHFPTLPVFLYYIAGGIDHTSLDLRFISPHHSHWIWNISYFFYWLSFHTYTEEEFKDSREKRREN